MQKRVPSSVGLCVVVALLLLCGIVPLAAGRSVIGRSAEQPTTTTTTSTTTAIPDGVTTAPPPPSSSSDSAATAAAPTTPSKCPQGVRCVPPIQCPAVVRTPPADRPRRCDLPAGSTLGYCCRTGANHTAAAVEDEDDHDTDSAHHTLSRSFFDQHHHEQDSHHHHHNHQHHPHHNGHSGSEHHHHHRPDRTEIEIVITEARAQFARTLSTEKHVAPHHTDAQLGGSHHHHYHQQPQHHHHYHQHHQQHVDQHHHHHHHSSPAPSYFHNLLFRSDRATEQRCIEQTHRAVERIYAGRLLQKRLRIAPVDFELRRVDAPLYGTALDVGCEPRGFWPPPNGNGLFAGLFGGAGGCDSPFRSADGSCNNPTHRRWGAAGTAMERLLPPAYEDGLWEPRWRSAATGAVLPNARRISALQFADADRPHPLYNLLLMQFGQFLTHDVSHSSSIQTDDGQSVACCTADGGAVLPPDQLHWACMPIEIPADDALYASFGQRCMSVVRSALAADGGGDCSLGYGRQLSKVSHYIDASAVYGTSERQQADLRAWRGGELRVMDDGAAFGAGGGSGGSLLPLAADGVAGAACGQERPAPCFLSGDGRSNQIVTLAALHTVWLREHNRVARELLALNGHWSDERVFQEARRIVVAQLQHIVYAEWLPLVVGGETMERFGLRALPDGYAGDYDAEVNAAVTSEFTAAAFRFGHSTVAGQLVVRDAHGRVEEIVPIPDVMFDARRLRRAQWFASIVDTLTVQPMQQVDAAVTRGLSGMLFRAHNPFGLDLAAINVQRGRDHAIRPYNDYLEATGHGRVTAFEQFGAENAAKLRAVYAHPDDVDLWVGGLLEAARGDALVGGTFADIVADQFSRLRRGDRYFYELGADVNPGWLRPEQLAAVRAGATMARLLCENADGEALKWMQPRAFVRPDVVGNAPVSCADAVAIRRLDLEPWRETSNYV